MKGLTDVSILQWRRESFFRRGMDSVRWFSRSHPSITSVSRLLHLSSAGTCMTHPSPLAPMSVTDQHAVTACCSVTYPRPDR